MKIYFHRIFKNVGPQEVLFERTPEPLQNRPLYYLRVNFVLEQKERVFKIFRKFTVILLFIDICMFEQECQQNWRKFAILPRC